WPAGNQSRHPAGGGWLAADDAADRRGEGIGADAAREYAAPARGGGARSCKRAGRRRRDGEGARNRPAARGPLPPRHCLYQGSGALPAGKIVRGWLRPRAHPFLRPDGQRGLASRNGRDGGGPTRYPYRAGTGLTRGRTARCYRLEATEAVSSTAARSKRTPSKPLSAIALMRALYFGVPPL